MSNLQEELEKLPKYGSDEGADYMADMNNWVCVHVTKYEPKNNEKGEKYIETTGMATGYKLPRATVHVTLNQIVGNHGYGNWDAASIVVLAPYNDVVRLNGNPQEVAAEDTYFAPNPDTGLVLPDSAYIVKPDAKCKELFVIGEHGATYKTENYTQQEIDKILKLNLLDESKYRKYLNGDFSEYEVDRILAYDKKLKQLYDKTKDKRAFLRGVMEEDRFVVLNHLLRNYVAHKALEKMGYHYIFAHEDNVSGKIAEVAREAGLKGDSGNKGHSYSVEIELEQHGCALVDLVEVLKTKKVDDIYTYLTESKGPLCEEVIDNILSDKPLPDIHGTFKKVYNGYVEHLKTRYEMDKNSDCIPDEVLKRWENTISKMDKGLEQYNPHINTTLLKHSRRMKLECTIALRELKQNSVAYETLKHLLSKRNRGQDERDKSLGEVLSDKKSDVKPEKFTMSFFKENERK